MQPIDKFVAWQLCAEICDENRDKWYTLDGLRCRRCWNLSKPTPSDRLVSQREDYRGCPLVNRRYDALQSRHPNLAHA
jgi:hypothetical protein